MLARGRRVGCRCACNDGMGAVVWRCYVVGIVPLQIPLNDGNLVMEVIA